MEQLKLKKGSIVVYLVLLVLVLVVMIIARNNAIKGSATNKIGRCDTINVAIQISPIGVTTIGDSLGGIYYDKINQIAKKAKFIPIVRGITDVQRSITDIENGIYDCVIADTTGIRLSESNYLRNIEVVASNDSLQSQIRSWAIIGCNPQLLHRIIEQ